uniref:Odorant binding protein 6 n=1 Tax=Laodelphax striatellus TaxID=195883 RepID=A0A096W1L6_LAOST|nr:odorant binding protein 6 [Laodelphax striatellus]
MLYVLYFVIVTSALSAVITQIMAADSSDMLTVFNKCRDKTSATEDDIKTFRAQQIPSTTTGKCMLACMFNHSGLMKDGKYDSEGALKLVGQVFADNPIKLGKARQLINGCTDEVKKENDKCEIASKIADCTVKMSSQVGLS